MSQIFVIRLFFLFISLLLVLSVIITHMNSQKVQHWDSIEGELEYVLIQNLSSPTVAGAKDWGKEKVSLRYSYKMKEKILYGNRIMLLDFVYTPKEFYQNLKYGKITVFFNPKNPEQSLLKKDYPATAISILLIASVAFLLLAATLPTITKALLNAIENYSG